MFPPGHAATKIIPKAILGAGFKSRTSKKLIRGKIKNWLATPTIRDLGFKITGLKSRQSMDKAMPNITKANAIFNTQILSLSKLICACSNNIMKFLIRYVL